MRITIRKSQLRAALRLAPTLDVRYYLNGVLVEQCANGDVHLVATDGVALFAGKLPGEGPRLPQVVILPHAVCKAAVKGAKDSDLVLTDEAGHWSLDSVPFKPVDGRYPDWRRVCPSATALRASPPQVAAIDWSYAEAAQAALREWVGFKSRYCPIAQRGNTTASVMSAETAFVVIMPMKPPGDHKPCEPFDPSPLGA